MHILIYEETPLEKDLLKILLSIVEMCGPAILIILTGMSYISDDFDTFRFLISFSTSSGVVGDMKKVFGIGFVR